MQTILNDILDKFDSLSMEEQESILETAKKKLIERKRELPVEEVREEAGGKYKESDVHTIMGSHNLKEILTLSKDERLELMEVIWDSLNEEMQDSEIPDWHKEILDERLKKIEKGEARFKDWDEIKKKYM